MGEEKPVSDAVAKLVEALESLGYVTVVRAEESKAQVRLLCRVTNKKAWCLVLERVLQNASNWTPHVCQQYFLKPDRKMVFGWNFIVNSENPAAACRSICAHLVAPEPVEVDTFPLRGALRSSGGASFNPQAPGPGRGGASHKGAFPVSGGKG